MARGRNGPMPPAAGGRIDALPDGVLERILGLLPAAEAVRTCVLARRWRHLWKSATSLHIGNIEEHVREHREFVYHLLLLRRGAPLEVCEFHFDGFENKDVPRLNLWFRYAVACNVRLLTLNAMPSESCRRFLELDDLPLVSQKLRILDLKFVRVNSSFLDFSGCPALKHLRFEFSEFSLSSETMTTISSESLERLSIVDSEFADGSEERSRIRICTPNLVSLRLEHLLGKTAMLVGNMPSLVEASVRIDGNCHDRCKKLLDPNNLDCIASLVPVLITPAMAGLVVCFLSVYLQPNVWSSLLHVQWF